MGTKNRGTSSAVRTRWASTKDFGRMADLDLSAEFDPDRLLTWAGDPTSVLILAEQDWPPVDVPPIVGWLRVDRRNQRVLVADLVLAGSGAGNYSPADVCRFLLEHVERIARRLRIDRLGVLVGPRQAAELQALRQQGGQVQSVRRAGRTTVDAFCFGFRLFRTTRTAEAYYVANRPWVDA
jgi:hypothetical protein